MPRPNRKIVRREVQRKLGRISDPLTLLPMPHAGENNKISVAEWEEYCQRKEIYQRAAPDFEKQLGRPSVHASQAVWDLVYPHTQSFREDFDALAMNGRSF